MESDKKSPPSSYDKKELDMPPRSHPPHKTSSRQHRPSYSYSRSRSFSRSYSPSRSRSRSYRRNFNDSYERERERERYYRRNSRSPRPRYRKKTSRDNSAENMGNVLYVSNLPRKIYDEDLKEKFEKYGKVIEISIVREPFSKESRGFGFITFESKKCAQDALDNLNKTEMEDKTINVEVSKRSKAHKPTPGVYLGPRSDNHRRRDYGREVYYRRRSRSRSWSRRRSRSRSKSYYRGDSRSRSRSYSRRSPVYRRK